jgi:hypothetical protein
MIRLASLSLERDQHSSLSSWGLCHATFFSNKKNSANVLVIFSYFLLALTTLAYRAMELITALISVVTCLIRLFTYEINPTVL